MINREDIALWPDGTWCWGEDLEEYLSMLSDDFEVLKFDTPEYDFFCLVEDLV